MHLSPANWFEVVEENPPSIPSYGEDRRLHSPGQQAPAAVTGAPTLERSLPPAVPPPHGAPRGPHLLPGRPISSGETYPPPPQPPAAHRDDGRPRQVA